MKARRSIMPAMKEDIARNMYIRFLDEITEIRILSGFRENMTPA